MLALEGRGFVSFSVILSFLLLATPVGTFAMELDTPTRATIIPESTIDAAATWTAASSPYIIEGNLTIGPSGALTIDKGVTVLVGKGLRIDVQGKLVTKGTTAAPVTVLDGDSLPYDGIFFKAGSYGRFEKLNLSGCDMGIYAEGAGTTVHVLNSTVEADSEGISAMSGATVWAINCTVKGSPRISVSGGYLYEGWWLFFRVVLDGGQPWQGAELRATVNREFDSREAYDAVNDIEHCPVTDADGRVRAIPIEEYYHDGSLDTFQSKVYLRMYALDPDRSWTKNSGNINITGNIDYVWTLDDTPPPAPANFTVVERGGSYLRVGWAWDHDPNAHQLARFELKYALTGETIFETDMINIKTQRQYNLTGLESEKEYKLALRAVDIFGNSAQTPYIDTSTRDITPPLPPENVMANLTDRIDVARSWDYSASPDVIGYQIFVNDTGSGRTMAGYADGKTTKKYVLSNLTSETEYEFWVRSVDDGDPPNFSPFVGTGAITTGDITPPVKPLLELYLVSPPQYIPGSPYYNRTYVGIRGTVAGENRTIIDIFVNGVPQQYSDEERPKTYAGIFTVYMSLQEGEHLIQACSTDPTGNKGELSEQLLVVVDRTIPILSFEKGRIEADEDQEFVLKVNASDENGVANITWTIKGGSDDLVMEGAAVKASLPVGSYEATCEVIDVAGNRNSSSIEIKVWVPDRLAPAPASTDPADNAVGVQVDTLIKVVFEETLKWDQVKGFLAKASAPAVSLVLHQEIDEANLTATYTPADTLDAVTDYIFTLSGIYDVRGNHGEDVIIRFTTLDPALVDSDGDGMPNYYEVQRSSFLSPSDESDAAEDFDGDGLTNLEEYEKGSDPAIKDSDDDGMDDGWEVQNGFSPTSNLDAIQDEDGDGYSNLDEFNDGTDPNDPDSHRSGEEGSIIGYIVIAVVVLLIIAVVVVVIWAYARKKGGETGEEEQRAPEEEAAKASVTDVEAGSLSCPSCGASISEDLDYCPECGAIVTRGPVADEAEEMMEEEEGSQGPEHLDEGPGTDDLPMPVEEEDRSEGGV